MKSTKSKKQSKAKTAASGKAKKAPRKNGKDRDTETAKNLLVGAAFNKVQKDFFKALATYHDVKSDKLKALWNDPEVKKAKAAYREALQALTDGVCREEKHPTITIFVSLRPKISRYAKYVPALVSANKAPHITLYPVRAAAYPINRIYAADANLVKNEMWNTLNMDWLSIKNL